MNDLKRYQLRLDHIKNSYILNNPLSLYEIVIVFIYHHPHSGQAHKGRLLLRCCFPYVFQGRRTA